MHKSVTKSNTPKAIRVDDENIFEKIYENMSLDSLSKFLEDLKTEDAFLLQSKNDLGNPENAVPFLNSNFIFVLTKENVEVWSREISLMPENIEEKATIYKTSWVLVQIGEIEFYMRAKRIFLVNISNTTEECLKEITEDTKRLQKENEKRLNFKKFLKPDDINCFKRQEDVGIFVKKKVMNYYMIALDSPLSCKEITEKLNSVGLVGGAVMQEGYIDEIANDQVIKQIIDCTDGKYLN